LWLRTHPHYLDILMKAVQDATTRLGLTEREQELICQLDRNARVAPLQALNGGFYDRIPRDTMAEFLLTELRKMIAL